jgi:acyl-coenzyme A synthetase/AMP-(fatty) acid ligase/pimeloyl-ACP methyl ester carboxylesterase
VTAALRMPAALPPSGLAGLDASWSRLVEAVDADGVTRTWHVLDSAAGSVPSVGSDGPAAKAEPVGALLCVHGNPTWSYLWRELLAHPPAGWRVLAVDHLDMGFSERTGTVRGLTRRIEDLSALTAAVGLTGPVVTVAHDWGGPISLGWALAHRDQLAGVVLTNTAVHHPAGSPAPALIRLVSARVVLGPVTRRTQLFIRGTLALGHPRLPADVRAGYLAPYAGANRRRAIAGFVEDIPLDPAHPSWATLQAVAAGLPALAGVPSLALWGPRDPVFGDRYLRDLVTRLPHAAVHRFEGAGHLVAEDAEVAETVAAWVGDLPGSSTTTPTQPPASPPGATASGSPRRRDVAGDGARRPLWSALVERGNSSGASDVSAAVVEMSPTGGRPRTISWALLERRVRELAAGLTGAGVHQGDRVVLLVPPGADLTAAVYACWRAGAVIVVADAGLGLGGLHRAVRGAWPEHVIAVGRGLAAARALGWPGQRIAAGALDRATRRALGARTHLAELAEQGSGRPLPEPPPADADAAVLFTSGATGAAKGVVYRHHQLEAQRDALAKTYGVGTQDRFVAAFAPFALYGPALGIATVVPAMAVTAPRTLTATALAEAAAAIEATMVFASPAALVNVLATAGSLDERDRAALAGVRLLLSAGAPVPAAVLRRAGELMPRAQLHTPYGMTEALPVTDATLEAIEEAGAGNGICVGRPVDGVTVALHPLGADGRAQATQSREPGVTGEIAVQAAHVKDRYDRLWLTERASAHNPGWHRTGDVGHLDTEGRLWVEGRVGHVITTADGPRTPAGIEQRVQGLSAVRLAAAVGVGPPGVQQVVVVIETDPPTPYVGLAPAGLAIRVRGQARVDVAAVLTVPALPVDIRHNSKIDRTRVARWAADLLAGGRLRRL